MGEPMVEVLCNCGQTLTAFLKEMAAKNAEVTCPYCGKSAGNPPQGFCDAACRAELGSRQWSGRFLLAKPHPCHNGEYSHSEDGD